MEKAQQIMVVVEGDLGLSLPNLVMVLVMAEDLNLAVPTIIINISVAFVVLLLNMQEEPTVPPGNLTVTTVA